MRVQTHLHKMFSAIFTLLVYYLIIGFLLKLGFSMITNLDEALEQNKRLVNETFRVTQEYE